MSCTNCADNGEYMSFKTDDTYLLPYIGAAPLPYVDLTSVVENAETDTNFSLDTVNKDLIYNSERAITGDGVSSTISLQSIAELMSISDLADVNYNGVVDNDLFVFNGTTNTWQPQTVLEDVAVSVIGISSDGRYVKQAVAGLLPAPTPSPSRVLTTVSAASITPNPTNYDQYNYTALAGNLTINSPGTSSDGQLLLFRIKDSGTSRTLTWNAIFRGIGVTIPTATTANKVLYVGAKYNSQDARWDVIAVSRQA